MCKCSPHKRTPFCGRPGCEWPVPAPIITDVGPYRPKHLKLVSLTDGCVLSAINCSTRDDEIRARGRLHALRERWLQNAVHISGEHLAVVEA